MVVNSNLGFDIIVRKRCERASKEIDMIEIIAKAIGTQIVAGVTEEIVKHSGEIADGALNVAADAVEFAGDCFCGILDGIGSLFD